MRGILTVNMNRHSEYRTTREEVRESSGQTIQLETTITVSAGSHFVFHVCLRWLCMSHKKSEESELSGIQRFHL